MDTINEAISEAVADRMANLDSLEWYNSIPAEDRALIKSAVTGQDNGDAKSEVIIVLAGMLTMLEMLASQ